MLEQPHGQFPALNGTGEPAFCTHIVLFLFTCRRVSCSFRLFTLCTYITLHENISLSVQWSAFASIAKAKVQKQHQNTPRIQLMRSGSTKAQLSHCKRKTHHFHTINLFRVTGQGTFSSMRCERGRVTTPSCVSNWQQKCLVVKMVNGFVFTILLLVLHLLYVLRIVTPSDSNCYLWFWAGQIQPIQLHSFIEQHCQTSSGSSFSNVRTLCFVNLT